MAYQAIDFTAPADTLPAGAAKINNNFTELYAGNGVVDTYAAARSTVGSATLSRLYVRGRTATNDGGQGYFIWVASATTDVDDGFELTATGGIWRREDTRTLTYEMFGAVPMTSVTDTSHDSTDAINALHAAIPTPEEARKPFKVLLQGFYGITAQIEFNHFLGVTFEGASPFSELGSGYCWIAAHDPTKHALRFRQCRYVTMRNLRVWANSEEEAVEDALLSAICLSSDYTASIQERCTFDNVVIGTRDYYDSLGTAYQFQRGWSGETVSGTFGNSDFHQFINCRVQWVGVAWYNRDSQSLDWSIRQCKAFFCDTFLDHKTGLCRIYDCESNLTRAAAFIVGQVDSTDITRTFIEGWVGEQNNAELAIITGPCCFSVLNGDFDFNRDPDNISIVNAAHPYLIVATTNNTSNITLTDPVFRTISPEVDFGDGATVKFFTVKGVRPNTIAIRNRGSVIDQRIVYSWYPGEGTYQLAHDDWAPFTQLIYPPYDTVPDYTVSELPNQTVRCGRRNVSACTDIKSVATNGTTSAAATHTFTNALPVGLILGVSLSINSVAGSLASMTVGDGSDADRWGTKAKASTSASNPPEASAIAGYADTSPFYNKTLGNVVVTAVGGTFNAGGTMTLTVHYIDFAQKYYNPNLST